MGEIWGLDGDGMYFDEGSGGILGVLFGDGGCWSVDNRREEKNCFDEEVELLGEVVFKVFICCCL